MFIKILFTNQGERTQAQDECVVRANGHDTSRNRDTFQISENMVLVLILTRTRNDAPRCIRVLFMNCKTYDVRGLRFLHVDGSVRCCIPQHMEITHKQGKKSSSFVIHIKLPFFLMSKRSFTKIDPRLA
jgi:hypothetical protein